MLHDFILFCYLVTGILFGMESKVAANGLAVPKAPGKKLVLPPVARQPILYPERQSDTDLLNIYSAYMSAGSQDLLRTIAKTKWELDETNHLDTLVQLQKTIDSCSAEVKQLGSSLNLKDEQCIELRAPKQQETGKYYFDQQNKIRLLLLMLQDVHFLDKVVVCFGILFSVPPSQCLPAFLKGT